MSACPTQVTIISLDDKVFEGYGLIDANNRILLKFGTENTDSYYPEFIFEEEHENAVQVTKEDENTSDVIQTIKENINR